MTERIEQEITLALECVERLLTAWTAIGDHQRPGETHQMMYSDIAEFANLRMETTSTVAELVKQDRISDALGLSRSLLEHALLLRLMTKGTRYFHVEADEKRTSSEFKLELVKRRAELETLHAKGEALDCLSVERYP